MNTFARRSMLLFFLAATACSAEPSADSDSGDSDDSTESGGEALGACENPDDDPGFGSLDRNSDGLLTLDDLEPGEAAVQAVWTDSSGAKTMWRQVSSSADIWHGDGNGDLMRYGVWLPLEHPEGALYTTAVFEGPVDGITEPGSFERVSSNWDIAVLERGGSNEEAAGTVELSYVEGDIASGTVPEPSGPIEIIDYIQQAPSGDVLCVQTIVFREITAEFTH